ncbi:MAG: glycosyltransferase family 9 protein [Candidatus Stahlbacteria bacterium]|nr:glycosyltransferase family 9 protein [Candidatus Stahlbacteria bacterium]
MKDFSNKKIKIVISIWPGIGDVVFTTPALRILRKKMPNSHITALVWSKGGKEVLSNNPNIDEIINGSNIKITTLIAKLKNYDIGIQCSQPVQFIFQLAKIKKRISFNGNPLWWAYPVSSNEFHSTEYYLQAIDKIDDTIMRDNYKWDIFPTPNDNDIAKKLLNGLHPPIIAIHPGARNNKNKKWSKNKFISLCKALSEKANILLIGGKADYKLCHYIATQTKATNIAGKLTLLQTAALIKKCNLFIGHASGPTYLANAVGTPIVAILGPDNPVNFGPIGENVKIITPKLKCAPCLHFYRNFCWGLRIRYIPICRAMRSITVEEVLQTCHHLLNP